MREVYVQWQIEDDVTDSLRSRDCAYVPLLLVRAFQPQTPPRHSEEKRWRNPTLNGGA